MIDDRITLPAPLTLHPEECEGAIAAMTGSTKQWDAMEALRSLLRLSLVYPLSIYVGFFWCRPGAEPVEFYDVGIIEVHDDHFVMETSGRDDVPVWVDIPYAEVSGLTMDFDTPWPDPRKENV